MCHQKISRSTLHKQVRKSWCWCFEQLMVMSASRHFPGLGRTKKAGLNCKEKKCFNLLKDCIFIFIPSRVELHRKSFNLPRWHFYFHSPRKQGWTAQRKNNVLISNQDGIFIFIHLPRRIFGTSRCPWIRGTVCGTSAAFSNDSVIGKSSKKTVFLRSGWP